MTRTYFEIFQKRLCHSDRCADANPIVSKFYDLDNFLDPIILFVHGTNNFIAPPSLRSSLLTVMMVR